MPANYVLLEKVTLTASAASVVFDNIPQTGYTDLKVVMSARTDRTAGSSATVSLKLNTTTTSVYSSMELAGTGSAPDTGAYVNVAPTALNVGRISQATDSANAFGQVEVYIPNCLSSFAKSASCESVQENNATAGFVQMTAWNCSDTAPINALTFTPNAGTNFVTNSEFSLYGIAAVGTTPVIAPFATGGDIVTNDGTYWYHAFLSSGAFVPNKTLSCDVLVGAGGGSGGLYCSGGGGAGGVIAFASQSLTSASYPVAVGAGGASVISVGGQQNGNKGSNSVFGSLTAAEGGGYGAGGAEETNGGNGGCGGGASGADQPITRLGGVGSQGFNGGGSTEYGAQYQGNGGGGMGSIGGSRSGQQAGAGGNGTNTVANWGSLSAAFSATGLGVSGYIAGGGGGGGYNSQPAPGAGGSGGGTAGSTSTSTANAAASSCSGSGGAYTISSGSGGSGIVIIRYPMV